MSDQRPSGDPTSDTRTGGTRTDRVLRRFTYLAGGLLVAGMLVILVLGDVLTQHPGDYNVRKGDQRLSEGKLEAALEEFDAALEKAPHHRGAMMGRALVFIRQERPERAIEELTDLIAFLEETLPEDRFEDPTGVGTLAAAYANRGVLHDRAGRYESALQDYIEAIRIDEEAIDGPSIFDEILYGYQAVTVRDRAKYIAKELQKPPEERLLRLPEKDAEQRMYKP